MLLVDDYATLRALYRIAIEAQARFRVVGEASDGAQGVAEARRLQPDLVVLDLSMPTMDGLEALVQIRKAAPGARVIILSGFQRDRVEPIALRLGATAYVEKGVRPTRLHALLEEAAQSPLPPAADFDAELRERVRTLV